MQWFGAGKLGALVVFVGAAVLEVLGDALIRKGMRGSGVALVAIGMAVLGAYVGIFAVVSVIIGRWMFKDQIPVSTWIGFAIILAGSMVIHLGRVT